MLVVSMLPGRQAPGVWRFGDGDPSLLVCCCVPFFRHRGQWRAALDRHAALPFQPSEFLKPLFVVSLAWLLSLRAKDPSLPVIPLTGLLTFVIAALLMKQPDFGQTMIFALVWVILLMLWGFSTRAIGFLGGAGIAGVVSAYLFYDTARTRIDSFLFPDPEKAAAEHYQTDMAHATLTAGGLIGTGPGAGLAKFQLPEAHTDYIFSVIGEEFGMIACIAIAILYLAIIVRVLVRLLDEEDSFLILAVAALIAQFGGQAVINMAVNTQIFPSKGMTLPFISYGGSSFIALSIGMGLLLSLDAAEPLSEALDLYGSNWNNK